MRTPLYWIEGPWTGRLAIMPRPRGGDWLEDEIQSWKSSGVNMVISTLTTEEISELSLDLEADLCKAEGLDFHNFPIVDRGVPTSSKAILELARSLETRLKGGDAIAIHCRQGIGRSGLLAACLLVLEGLDTDSAFARIGVARGGPVPDTVEQRKWVAKFAQDYLATDVRK